MLTTWLLSALLWVVGWKVGGLLYRHSRLRRHLITHRTGNGESRKRGH
jgi:hypothetical protein